MKVFAKILFTLIFVGLIGYGSSHFVKEGLIRLQGIQIVKDEGSQQDILFERIRKEISQDFNAYLGKWIWEVSLTEILSRVENDPRVKSVSVSRAFPNSIRVTISPHQPVVGLLDTKGLLHPIATDGGLLPAIAPNDGPDLPVLRGLFFFEDHELRKKAIQRVLELPEQGVFSRKTLSEVHFDKKEGFEFVLVPSGTLVKLGDQGLGEKIEKIEQVLNYLNDQRIKGRVIDARFAKKVVVRVNNAQ